MEEENYQLPEAEDRLFGGEGGYNTSAMIRSGESSFFLYSDAYQTATLVLLTSAKSSFDRDTLVYPIVFLARHFFELRLKELIGGMHYAKHSQYHFTNGHSLRFLWSEYLVMMAQMSPSTQPSGDSLQNVGRLILEFNDLDPHSMSFRYPVGSSADRSPSLTITHLDLVNFESVFRKMVNFFNAQSDGVFNEISLSEEYISILREAYASDMYER